HYPVFTIIHPDNILRDRVAAAPRKFRKFSDSNIQSFINNISLASWDELFNCTDPDNAFQIFNEIINATYDSSFPVITRRERQPSVSFVHKPWFNEELIQLSVYKQMLYKKYKRSGIESDFVVYKNIKKRFEQQCVSTR